jgi:hypothetical protein
LTFLIIAVQVSEERRSRDMGVPALDEEATDGLKPRRRLASAMWVPILSGRRFEFAKLKLDDASLDDTSPGSGSLPAWRAVAEAVG